MELNRLTREADEQIRKVVARYNQLYAPGGTISQVELDILLDELRKLYDTFKTIGYINQTRLQHRPKPEVAVHSPAVAGIQEEPVAAATPISQSYVTPESEPSQSSSHAQTQPETQPELRPQPEHQSGNGQEQHHMFEAEVVNVVSEAAVEKIVPEEPIKQQPEQAYFQEKHEVVEPGTGRAQNSFQDEAENVIPGLHPEHAASMLADRFSQGNKPLGETMAQAPANDPVASRVVFQPITDLSAGIGINDRYIFVSELFGNNTGQYQEAITRINKAVNLDEANWIFQKYHTSAWNQKQEVVARMKDFIKRRFI